VILSSLGAVVAFFGLVTRGVIGIVIAILFVPIWYFVTLILYRVGLEVLLVVFRVADDVQAIRGNAPGAATYQASGGAGASPQYPQSAQYPQYPRGPEYPHSPEYQQSPQYPQYPQSPQYPQDLPSPEYPQSPQDLLYPQDVPSLEPLGYPQSPQDLLHPQDVPSPEQLESPRSPQEPAYGTDRDDGDPDPTAPADDDQPWIT
jgi:hypothetical protein